jgi:hypothetical protein
MTRPRMLVGFVVALVLSVIAACVTLPEGTARLSEVVREVPGGDPPWQRDDSASGVRLRRGGSEQSARVGMVLERGDVLVTGSGVAAVLQIGGRGEVALDENTEVRVGSLEVLFGRVFANLRGVFTVRSQTVEAVNEGTRFLFEVGRDRSVRVVVADGVVTCRSPSGAWPDVRLAAGRSLLYFGQGTPRVQPANPRDVDGPLRAITSAPRAGWCCSGPGGRVYSSFEGRCPGPWSVSRESTEAQCRPTPPPPQTGWCCVPQQRRLLEMSPERCTAVKGTYYTNETVAKQRCVFVN